MGFLIQVTKSKEKILKGGSYQKVAVEKVIHGAGEQPLQTYLDRRQEKVVECVALWYIFEVHARDTGNKGGGGSSGIRGRDRWQWRNS